MSVLKTLLKERGYTVSQFADIAGVSKRSLDVYVSGARDFKNTPVWLAVKVADALHVDIHDLLFLTTEEE